jgi:hypothetical protein
LSRLVARVPDPGGERDRFAVGRRRPRRTRRKVTGSIDTRAQVRNPVRTRMYVRAGIVTAAGLRPAAVA